MGVRLGLRGIVLAEPLLLLGRRLGEERLWMLSQPLCPLGIVPEAPNNAKSTERNTAALR